MVINNKPLQTRNFMKFPNWKFIKKTKEKINKTATDYSKKAETNWRESIRGVSKSIKETWKAETDRYNKYYEATQKGITNRKQQVWNNIKYHVKHTPIYVFKISKIGMYYGWQAVKISARTRPGGAVITLIGFWYGSQLLYIYGTRRTKEVFIVDKFQRNDYSETDGLTGYLFTDEQNDNYRVVGSMMYFQFYPVELWTAIKKNRPYTIVYYGIRIAPLKIWPNVVRIYPLDKKGDYQREIEDKRRKRKEKLKKIGQQIKEGADSGWEMVSTGARNIRDVVRSHSPGRESF